jgi:hypothetical protein
MSTTELPRARDGCYGGVGRRGSFAVKLLVKGHFGGVLEVRIGCRFSRVGLCYDSGRLTALPNRAPPSFPPRPTPCLPTGWRAHGYAHSKSHP